MSVRRVVHAIAVVGRPGAGKRVNASILIAAAVLLIAAGCSSSSKSASTTSTRERSSTSTTGRAKSEVCGNPGAHPAHYQSVVVFAFENRTWTDVGLAFGPLMPYLHALGERCTSFTDWTETDPEQNSLTQYVGQVTGARQAGTVDDCNPSPTCSTDADSIFRQVRTGGRDAVNYVEGATVGCSAAGNAAKHVPALYLWGADDRAHCNTQVRPMSEFDPTALPAFAFVTPTLCNDGHDCANATVDAFARAHVQPVLASAAYRAGKVAMFVWYDEDRPVPNLWITPTATSGTRALSGAGYAGTLAAWEAMLGLPCLGNACRAPDMRATANS